MIKYHESKLAVDVKDRHLYRLDPIFSRTFTNLTSDEWNEIYDSVCEDFWQFLAPHIAERYGYGEVYSEGRSGGWLVVENPPSLEGDSDEMVEGDTNALNTEVEQWEDFATAIEQLVDEMRLELLSQLGERIDDNRTERTESQAMAARDIITVER